MRRIKNFYNNRKVSKFWRFFDKGTTLTFIICFFTGRLIDEAISHPWCWFIATPLLLLCIFYLSGIFIYKNDSYVR